MFWILLLFGVVNAVTYDSFSGRPATGPQLNQFDKYGTTSMCTNEIAPCDPNERRRIDGSCNNLKNPQRGAIHTPSYRVLPPVYSDGYRNRKSICGTNEELKPPRIIRYETLLEGKASSSKFTQLVTYFVLFMFNDIGSVQDVINYLKRKTYCCEEKGKYDDECTPNLIYENDPVHRFSNVRCMNLTSPYTFQYFKCRSNKTTPSRILPSTPLFDLSNIYNYIPGGINDFREYKGGRLQVELVNGLTYPLSGNERSCIANQKPKETLCHKYLPNGVMGSNIFHIWFYRLHNVVAANLERINPCWDDNKIFYTTREILIAGYLQIYYYQFLPLLFGMERLIKDGVISKHKGYRDVYDEKIIPQMSDEYSYVLRWFHIAQEATLELYDENYKCFKTFPMVNLTTRTAYFPENDHEAQIARGSFLQSTSKFMDHAVDPDISEVGLGGLQYAFDITAADVAKGRLFGFAPYVDYLEVCRKKKFKTFKDLLEVMDEDRIKRLRRVYKCAQDVDLMPGLWSERKIKDGSVPGTLYCLMAEQLLRSIKSDRHWYERRNRPYAFTPEQLSQIRNSNMGKLLCRVAPGITKITKNPFLVRSERNKMVSCDELPEVDFNAWKECKQ